MNKLNNQFSRNKKESTTNFNSQNLNGNVPLIIDEHNFDCQSPSGSHKERTSTCISAKDESFCDSLNNSNEEFVESLVSLYHDGNKRVCKLENERDRVLFELRTVDGQIDELKNDCCRRRISNII